MNAFRLILLCAALAWPIERTRQDLDRLVGKKGEQTHLYDLYTARDSLREISDSLGIRIDSLEASGGGGDLDSAVILAPSSSARNVIQSTAANAIPLVIKGSSGQTANLLQFRNSAGFDYANVSPLGAFNGAGYSGGPVSGSTGSFSVSLFCNGSTTTSGLLVNGTTFASVVDGTFSKSSNLTPIRLNITHSGTNDAQLTWTAGSTWSAGPDNSDADAWVLSEGSALGTNNALRITPTTRDVSVSSGDLTFGAAGKGVVYQAGPVDAAGSGSPEGVLALPQGSTYRRTDGGAGTSFYVKESGGSGNTGWVGK